MENHLYLVARDNILSLYVPYTHALIILNSLYYTISTINAYNTNQRLLHALAMQHGIDNWQASTSYI